MPVARDAGPYRAFASPRAVYSPLDSGPFPSYVDIGYRYRVPIVIDREFQRGFIKLYALWRASKGEVYGVQIIEEMRVLGFRVSPGTLYPVLHTLLEEKDVTVADRVVNGKVRKLYRATPKGGEEAEEVIEKLTKLLRKFR